MSAPARRDAQLALAQQLLACLTAELAAAPAGPVCVAALRHSATVAPADACMCECVDGAGQPAGQGEAWVRVVSATMPGLDRQRGCPRPEWQVTYELGSRRCVTTLDGAGRPPTAAEADADAVSLAGDAAAHRRVLGCCPGLDERVQAALAQLPAGPTGGCAGWVTRLTVGVLGW
jgi:hypothetical protein